MTDDDARERWAELLQELRVAQTGVQILTGFLLTLPFTQRFTELDRTHEVVYGVVLCAAMVATILLLSPVAMHRALFRKGQRAWLVHVAHVVSRCGLAAMAVANVSALWLVLDVVAERWVAWTVASGLAAFILVLWVLIPAWQREVDD